MTDADDTRGEGMDGQQPQYEGGFEPGRGVWQPLPHGGEYDSDSTMSVPLDAMGLPDLSAMPGLADPLAAPGHGYAPPPGQWHADQDRPHSAPAAPHDGALYPDAPHGGAAYGDARHGDTSYGGNPYGAQYPGAQYAGAPYEGAPGYGSAQYGEPRYEEPRYGEAQYGAAGEGAPGDSGQWQVPGPGEYAEQSGAESGAPGGGGSGEYG
ncbi:hypothetical protein ACFV1B_02370, partial [Streptomyces sp. NPDC059637]